VDIDVALVPGQARAWRNTVCIVIDELRASSTITTLLDGGCASLHLTSTLGEARRLAAATGSLLLGERHGRTPRGFDGNNSPAELRGVDVRGRNVVLSTTNGTVVLGRVRSAPAVLVGCLLNARACADAAVAIACELDASIGIVCAGQRGRFAVDDAIAAGYILHDARAALDRRGEPAALTDSAIAALKLRASSPDLVAALRECEAGRLVTALGAGDDVDLCARLDSSATVPVLRGIDPIRIERLAAA